MLIYALGRSSNQQQRKKLMSTRVPLLSFLEKKEASAMQKFIVPWNIMITLHCLSYVKKMTNKEIKAQLIAIIDYENLMPGFSDCAEQARKHSVTLGDFARRVKATAGMY
jgi:hypothetical protein